MGKSWEIPKDVENYGNIFNIAKKMSRLNYFSTIGYWKKKYESWMKMGIVGKICFLIPFVIFSVAWALSRVVVSIINPFLFPIIVLGLSVALPITIDQLTYPTNAVNPIFAREANKDLTKNQKVALLFQAVTEPMKNELESTFGWCPNDIAINPQAYLDNRCNRQLGVKYSTVTAVQQLSASTTKFDKAANENKHTSAAWQYFAYKPDKWGWMGTIDSASEVSYKEGLKEIRAFVQQVKEADTQGEEIVDIRSDDLYNILNIIVGDKGILMVAYGGLDKRSGLIPWNELDDNIYQAVGAAIVARNLLITLKSCFPDEMNKGGMNVLNEAIDSLDAAIKYNPWIITCGDGETWWVNIMPDHRSKMQRYYTRAVRSVEDLQKSLKM